MKSGMLAAEAVYDLVMDSKQQEREFDPDQSQPFANYKTCMLGTHTASMTDTVEPVAYETSLHNSWVAEELKVCRNSHASFHSPLGLAGGMIHTALSSFITKVRGGGGGQSR
jgi:electron-transferring-flavoprotein dehydrogenase